MFLGQIVETSGVKSISRDYDFINAVKFTVESQWKGTREKQIIVLLGVDIPGMCGDMSLTSGRRYLIYAYRTKEGLVTYADCGPNMEADFAKADLKNLNRFWFRVRSRLWPFGK